MFKHIRKRGLFEAVSGCLKKKKVGLGFKVLSKLPLGAFYRGLGFQSRTNGARSSRHAPNAHRGAEAPVDLGEVQAVLLVVGPRRADLCGPRGADAPNDLHLLARRKQDMDLGVAAAFFSTIVLSSFFF